MTRDGRVIGGSEVGMIPIENDNVVAKGRLMPGRMFLIDFAQVRSWADFSRDMKSYSCYYS